MADISQYLQSIMNAVYGEDVRGSIHDAIEIINDVSEVVLSTGTAVDSASSSSTGFYTDSLYLNTNTFELWKCIGTDSWQSQGTLKGENGNGIASIEKTGTSGLVDTYTITYDDGDTDTFTVTNGEDGVDGNKWYRGTGISGKAVNPTVYSGSGITEANPNDFYLNPSEGAIYHCVSGGDPTVATWSFDFTMTGGGGGGASWGSITGTLSDQTDLQNTLNTKANANDVPSNLNDLSDVTITSPSSGQGLKYNGNGWVNANMLAGKIFGTATSADGQTVTFSGIDKTKSYLLSATLPDNYDGEPIGMANVELTNGGTTVTYTVTNASINQSFELIEIG